VADGELAAFVAAGRALFSLGLIRGSEGNLSTFDGSRLVITRTGSELHRLAAGDLIGGPLDADLDDASSDLDVHRRLYTRHGPGAVVHCHPPGTVPDHGALPGRHGDYAFAPTLDAAVADAVTRSRER
jgi:ribulose-5-phosphate 4-epimerase/fuculose-1-phosphate aldolase